MLNVNKKVAIVAIHGIADQKIYSSAREIADVLNSVGRVRHQANRPIPAASEEHLLRIPVDRVEPKVITTTLLPRHTGLFGRLKKWFKVGPSLVDVRLENHPYQGEAIDDDALLAKLESEYLNHQLAKYDRRPWAAQPTEHYHTIRVDQSVNCPTKFGPTESGPTEPVTAHVYEMHWADLSRLGSGPLLLLNELYQLLFHLASLGHHVVALGFLEASERYPRSSRTWKFWQSYLDVQEASTALISLWIPILSLHVLLLLIITLLGKLQLAMSLQQFPLGMLLQYLWPSEAQGYGDQIFALVVYAGLSALVHIGPIAAYEKRRPGANIVHQLVWLVTTVVLTMQLARPDWLPIEAWPSAMLGHHVITFASFRTIEILYTLLSWVWLWFNVAHLACIAFGWKVRRIAVQQAIASPSSAQSSSNWLERIDRCNWTARLSLAATAALYFVLSMGLWSGLNQLEQWLKILPQAANSYRISNWFAAFIQLDPVLLPAPVPSPIADPAGWLIGGDRFIQVLLQTATSPLFVLNLVLIAITILICVQAFLPSVWRDIQQPSTDTQISALGHGLDQGFRRIRHIAVPLLVVNMAVIFPLGYLLAKLVPLPLFHQSSWQMLLVLGILQPLFLAGVFFLRGFQAQVRGVLDAILDVDNYLRVHPREDNPRSRIFARYVSLLRYLATQDYDGIVLVAHSQGSVITTDVLRFLAREAKLAGPVQRDPALARLLDPNHPQPLPVSLFTMGAPIHQLYSFSFPHLYHWAAHYDEPAPDRTCDRPCPQDLGLCQWVNAYGSGDYVGRYLWGRSDQMYQPNQRFGSGHPNCYEFCLSEGAHTHYWDGSRSDIAKTLQLLIGALVNPVSVPPR
jgi:hypothetical protein